MPPGQRTARLAAEHERFVAFTFTGANLVTEVASDGTISYAAGAFRTEFGVEAETFIGRRLHDIVAPPDHQALDCAMLLLTERGRCAPMTVRLANPRHTQLALAGLFLPGTARPSRFCFTFAPLPTPPARVMASARTLQRAAESRLGEAASGHLGLIEVIGNAAQDAVGAALETIAPGLLAGPLAPGQFGLVGDANERTNLVDVARLLEQALQEQGATIRVAHNAIPLAIEGLTPTQAVRALRQALNVFARNGAAGLEESGFEHGLSGFLAKAGVSAKALQRAIHAGHFDMVFQPIVTLAGGETHHYEALIRPRPIPDCRIAGPQDFILMVESLDLSGAIDLVVAERACAAAQAVGVHVAFNVSSLSMQQPDFRTRLIDLLRGNPAVQAGHIGVEMTETADVENLPEATETVAALRTLGIPFCLDDFGAGAADVRILRALGADIVKLDGSYVQGVAEPGRERAFLAGMVEIARAASARVVAEHVETERDARALEALGVEYGQGWLFGRPGPLPGAPD